MALWYDRSLRVLEPWQGGAQGLARREELGAPDLLRVHERLPRLQRVRAPPLLRRPRAVGIPVHRRLRVAKLRHGAVGDAAAHGAQACRQLDVGVPLLPTRDGASVRSPVLEEPVMMQGPARGEPVLALGHQEPADEVHGQVRGAPPPDADGLLHEPEHPRDSVGLPQPQVPLGELVVQYFAAPVHEGVLFRQQEDHHDPDGPHVNLVVVARAVRQQVHLWRHERGGPGLGREEFAVQKSGCKSEVT
mmetsp:Transcript_25077/g.70710  ORF Transcript_25077/g.70710 Transcript_25077/m.70710 type:complete len:247 (+) Transcript_25077:211-951(+)